MGKCSKPLKTSGKHSNEEKYFQDLSVSKDSFVSCSLKPHNLMDQDVLWLKRTVRVLSRVSGDLYGVPDTGTTLKWHCHFRSSLIIFVGHNPALRETRVYEVNSVSKGSGFSWLYA